MKSSIVLSAQPTSFSALTYQGSLEDNIAKIGNLGYDGVELAVRDPQLLDVPKLQSLLARYRLPVSAIGTGQIYGEEGLSFTHPEPDIRKKAIERIKSHIALAGELGGLVIIGLVRGKSGSGADPDRTMQWLIEALQECASEDETVKLAVEPINRYETDLVNTVASGLDLLEKVQMQNVGLLLDTFHMNIEESSMVLGITSSGDRLFHLHIADSNRWYPGAGHIDFKLILSALNKVNYQGYISAEIMPFPDPDTAAERVIQFIQEFNF